MSHQLSVISLTDSNTDNCQLTTDNSRNWLSGDAAGELLRFFRRIDADSGALVHDFTDPDWDTRFLGDLYQDLSEAARKKYALLQTPEFVEEFILDRTLEPALDEFGLVVSGQLSVVSCQSSVVSEETDNQQLTAIIWLPKRRANGRRMDVTAKYKPAGFALSFCCYTMTIEIYCFVEDGSEDRR